MFFIVLVTNMLVNIILLILIILVIIVILLLSFSLFLFSHAVMTFRLILIPIVCFKILVILAPPVDTITNIVVVMALLI